jgi:hypothetical protein
VLEKIAGWRARLATDGRQVLREAATPPFMASQICASWNHLAAWLRAVDCLRRAA